jgi:heme A synthase
VLQVALGILTVLLRLDPPVRAAHAAVGYALWGALVWLSVRTGTWQPLLGDTEQSRRMVEAARAS